MWEVVMRHNEKGIVVQVTDGKTNSTVARVAYDRHTTKNAFRPFKVALRAAIARAEEEAASLNHGEAA